MMRSRCDYPENFFDADIVCTVVSQFIRALSTQSIDLFQFILEILVTRAVTSSVKAMHAMGIANDDLTLPEPSDQLRRLI